VRNIGIDALFALRPLGGNELLGDELGDRGRTAIAGRSRFAGWSLRSAS
jgi:hypothetical protein